MKVGIIGRGGREHSICFALSKSKKIKQIYCFPGNAGTSQIAKNISIDEEDFNGLKNSIISNKIDLVIVGPEKPLVNGIVDFLEMYNINVFGPNKSASQLEGSKIFTKNLCKKYKIPTAKFGIFKDINSALLFTNNTNYPLVIKADGLASGKGVYICENKSDSDLAINEIFKGKFGVANNLLIEEFLAGEEMSYFIVTDGNTIKKFGTAQDHKRVLEGDLGKNTGGMGAYSPSRLINDELEKKIIDRIIEPTVRGLKEIDINYKGFLYVGLMIVKGDPYLIEYNVRMGDPECQTILPRLNSSLVDIFIACCEGNLEQCIIKWHVKKSLCVVLCSKGYPDIFKKKSLIKNIEKIILNKNEYLYHAGTTRNNNKVFSNGGRVLNFVCLSKDFLEARSKIFNLINQLAWNDGFYRKDIGYKVID